MLEMNHESPGGGVQVFVRMRNDICICSRERMTNFSTHEVKGVLLILRDICKLAVTVFLLSHLETQLENPYGDKMNGI